MSKDNIIQIAGKSSCWLYRAICIGILFVISSLTLSSTAQNLTGISGNVVTLDDREDHNWSYYSDGEQPIHSLKPADIKITYLGYGDNTMTTTNTDDNDLTSDDFDGDVDGDDVAVGPNVPGNTFIYYKTLENADKEGTSTHYPYTLIPNPFSKRPTGGTASVPTTRTIYLVTSGNNNGRGTLTVTYTAADGRDATETVNINSNNFSNTRSITAKVGGTISYSLQRTAGTVRSGAYYDTSDGTEIWYVTRNNNGTSTPQNSYTIQAGSPSTDYRGFYAWRVKRLSGVTISGHVVGDIIPAEEEIEFVADPNSTDNAVDFEALWAKAYVVTSNIATGLHAGVSYERNFVVTTSAITANLNVPVTYSTYNPDGTGGSTNTVTLNASTLNSDTKFEYINLTGGNQVTADNHYLCFGRGISAERNAASVRGMGAASSDELNYMLRLESGRYDGFAFIGNGNWTMSNRVLVKAVLGCDYDRANNNNGLLDVARNSSMFYSTGGVDFSNVSNMDQKVFDCVFKSGTFQSNVTNDGAYDHSIYCGHNSASAANNQRHYPGARFVTVEGGNFASLNGGRATAGWQDPTYTHDAICFSARIKGGTFRGSVYGGAADNPSGGSKQIIITGGTILGWVAAGANGTGSVGGSHATTNGNSYIYVGGNSTIGSANPPTINETPGGNVFGAGRGRAAQMASIDISNVVVADNTTIYQNVYGGGYNGTIRNTSNVYILGGTVMQSVFGGAYGNNGSVTANDLGGTVSKNIPKSNITMKGGTVLGGVYGGSNSSGTVVNVTMQINGGTVGDGSEGNGIFGGGYGQPTVVSGNVDLTLGASGQTVGGVLVNGDVYGGSALGSVNTNTSNHTYVTLNKGTINGSLYGGGLGDLAILGAGHSNVAANVYGPVAVKVYGGSVVKTDNNPGGVFGANNLNGAPQSSVTVDIYSTDAAPSEDSYAINAVYGGGNRADYIKDSYPTVTVHNGGTNNSIGYVYGGGNAARVRQTQVKVYGGNKIGNVFGGGNGTDGAAPVTNNSNVDIYGGTILNVFGGSNADGLIGGNVVINVNEQAETGYDLSSAIITNVYGGGNMADVSGSVSVNMTKGKVTGDLYGGGALANTNIGNATNYGAANESITSTATYTTTVNLKGGTVGNAYGGGLGDADHAALVYGDVSVLLDGTAFTVRYEGEDDNRKAVSGRLFGCNNVNGTPKGTVTVTVEKTVGEGGSPKPDKGTNTYELAAVYGGGNEAEYLPISLANAKPVVIINGCDDTSIEYVYGGGNAASVPATDVTVNGCYEIGWVFGGGNGKDKLANGASNPGANVGYHAYTIDGYTDEQAAAIKTAAEYGSGKTAVKLYGGTIHNAFGGSNTKGNVKELAEVTLDHPEDDSNLCALVVNNVFGAGNEAPMDGTANIILGCVDYLSEIYGGANQADLNNNVVLTIQSGSFGRVFGGNNLSGEIKGTITVNIEETGCKPIIIGELYGGGNQAEYTAPSGEDGPTVNVKSFTSIGRVFGGGLGAGAVVTGDTYVNIDEAIITTDKGHSTKAYAGETINFSDGKSVTLPSRPANTEGSMGIIGEVYGGGNEAKVDGNTNVNIATLETVDFESLTTDKTKQVEGANITGNIYGGGNQAEVTGKPTVTIGKQP